MTANPQALPPLEVWPRDIEPYRRGNAGVDFVWRFDSGIPGPRVAVSGLTHGCELCGMTAVTWLLDRGLRPARGALTLWLANVEAYRRFDPAQLATDHTANRFVDRDLNRCWGDEILDAPGDAVELRRARELRPVLLMQDALLDLHSTTYSARPFWVYRSLPRARALAAAIGFPSSHLLWRSPGPGVSVIEHGELGEEGGRAVGVVAECGTHFARAAGELAIQVALRFLLHHGTIRREAVADALAPLPAEPPRFYEVADTYRARHDEARFVRTFAGFEELAAGEPILVDGGETLAAPFDRCVVLMPRPTVRRGREMVTLARLVD